MSRIQALSWLKQFFNQNKAPSILLFGLVTWIAVYWLWWTKYSNCCHQTSASVTSNNSLYDMSDMVSDSDFSIMEPKLEADGGLKILTWNLQGLMRDELEKRTEAVVSSVFKEKPDAMFFQELIPMSYEMLVKGLGERYVPVPGTENPHDGYFTGIFYSKSSFKLEKHQIIKFWNSVMERTLLIVKLSFGRIRVALMTTHLESLPQYRTARIEQLNECFKICSSFSKQYNVIFGGDLNLEDMEEEGLVPSTIHDLWEICGSPEDSKYTWDLTENQNLEPIGETLPKKRYDRLYFRNSLPVSLHLRNFELQGKSRVGGLEYFPSDHWSLVATFQVSNETNGLRGRKGRNGNQSICKIS